MHRRISVREKALALAETYALHQLEGLGLPSAEEEQRIVRSIPERQATLYNRILEVEYRLRLFICRDLELRSVGLKHRLERMQLRLEAVTMLETLSPLPLVVAATQAGWLENITEDASLVLTEIGELRAMAQAGLDYMQEEQAEIPAYTARLEQYRHCMPHRALIEMAQESGHLPSHLPEANQSTYHAIRQSWRTLDE
jgi:hypothetical protein